jgi:hypothetical protein
MTDPTHPKFADDDTQGHIYVDSDADVTGRPEQAVASPGADGDEDTEGHRYATADDSSGPKPEGLQRPQVSEDGDDTEGHVLAF